MSADPKPVSPTRTAVFVGLGMGLAFVLVMYVILPIAIEALPVTPGWTPAEELSELTPSASTFRVLRDGKIVISGTLRNPTAKAFDTVSFTVSVFSSGELVEKCHAFGVTSPAKSETPFVVNCQNPWKEMQPETLSASFHMQGGFLASDI